MVCWPQKKKKKAARQPVSQSAGGGAAQQKMNERDIPCLFVVKRLIRDPCIIAKASPRFGSKNKKAAFETIFFILILFSNLFLKKINKIGAYQ